MNRISDSIHVVLGDLTDQSVDALVNAANEHLQHGGGVAASILRAGGRTIQEESDSWVERYGPLEPGMAASTGAGRMQAEMVVHVAGPRYRPEQDNRQLLATSVDAALNTAASAGARSVALPAISAGIFGYPLEEATRVIATTCAQWLEANPDSLHEIRLVGFDQRTADAFQEALA